MDDNLIFDEIAAHLPQEGVTAEKLAERGTVCTIDDDEVVFDVLHHKAMLGDRYVRGCEMAAMAMERRTYCFDRKSGDINCNRRELVAGSLNVDFHLLARRLLDEFMFSVEWDDESGLIIACDWAKEPVQTQEQAVEWAEEMVSNWDIRDTYLSSIQDEVTQPELEEIERKLLRALVAEAGKQAADAWQKR